MGAAHEAPAPSAVHNFTRRPTSHFLCLFLTPSDRNPPISLPTPAAHSRVCIWRCPLLGSNTAGPLGHSQLGDPPSDTCHRLAALPEELQKLGHLRRSSTSPFYYHATLRLTQRVNCGSGFYSLPKAPGRNTGGDLALLSSTPSLRTGHALRQSCVLRSEQQEWSVAVRAPIHNLL